MQDVSGITGAAPVWLDGTNLGSARTLALVNADGHPLDTVTIEVRGIATAAVAEFGLDR